MKARSFVIFIAVSLFFVSNGMFIQGQTSTFTYQGNLKNGEIPANGNYDFQFLLIDGFGVQRGNTNTRLNVPVTNGLFSVQLSFGNEFLSGSILNLEIRVRPVGGNDYTTLSPRQFISSAPYSVKSLAATTAEIATNSTQLDGIAASGFIQNSTSAQSSSNFNVSGNGTANIFNASTQFNIAGNRFLSNAGVRNTFTGVSAGTVSPDGNATDNSFYGDSAGQSNTIGSRNSFFGSLAGKFNTSGDSNSFFGTEAGMTNSNGGGNSFFGSSAGKLNTIGGSNSFFGATAGDENTTGSDNAFFGRASGGANTIGNQNSFFGRNAGQLNISGADNAFFGFGAGQKSTATNNSFFGSQAGLVTTTGGGNSIFGTLAGSENTVGIDNAFFGVNSGRGNISGNQNAFFGRLSGRFNTTGSSNTFIGYNSGTSNITGDNNTAIGASANIGEGVSFATAIGAGASVSSSGTIVIGRSFDKVFVRGDQEINSDLIVNGDSFLSMTSGNDSVVDVCRDPSSNRLSTCASSIRYKTNVQPLKSGLGLIQRLRPVTYNWKTSYHADLGLIAEEVAEVEPLLATYNVKGEVEGVQYKLISVVLINAVQEQQILIESLKKLNNEQANQLAEQKSTISAFKSALCRLKPDDEICKP